MLCFCIDLLLKGFFFFMCLVEMMCAICGQLTGFKEKCVQKDCVKRIVFLGTRETCQDAVTNLREFFAGYHILTHTFYRQLQL